MVRYLSLCCALALTGLGAALPGDAQHGRQLFVIENCIGCHSVDGQGGGRAADLAKRIGRDSAPSTLAALMWNRAPAMWSALDKAGLPVPRLSEQQVADLFAYFYSARFFDRPGEAVRGQRLLDSKRCAECHASPSAARPGAKPPAEWQPAADAVDLLEQMWNHAGQMRAALAEKQIDWPELGFQDLADLLVYIRSLRQPPWHAGEFIPASSQAGEKLFNARDCRTCHTGPRSHASRYTGRALADFAAAMWNAAPKMAPTPPSLGPGEMRRIAGYLWTLQLLDPPGNAARGKQVFAKKGCANCHETALSGAPGLAGRPSGMHPFALAAALWQHGPNMRQKLEQRRAAWPVFTGSEMPDLIAFLNRPATVPPSHTHR